MTQPVQHPPQRSCAFCLETDIVMFDDLRIGPCPGHAPFPVSPAVFTFRRAVERLRAKRIFINRKHFELARFLTLFDTENPCSRGLLELQFCEMDIPSRNERRVKKWIEELRRDWLLPIGSHKADKGGYYFITDAEDFLRWQKENLKAALTAIRTNYRVFRHNFKEMAGQVPLDFRVHVEDDLKRVLEDA